MLQGGSNLNISVEFIISIAALIISISTAIFEYLWNRGIHRTDLEAEFYKNIFMEYLIKKIPEARNVIHYGNGVLDSTDDLIDVLNDLRRDILFFKFKDEKYYKNLYKALQDLEDKLVEQSGPMGRTSFGAFQEELDENIQNLYGLIMNKYVGKRINRHSF